MCCLHHWYEESNTPHDRVCSLPGKQLPFSYGSEANIEFCRSGSHFLVSTPGVLWMETLTTKSSGPASSISLRTLRVQPHEPGWMNFSSGGPGKSESLTVSDSPWSLTHAEKFLEAIIGRTWHMTLFPRCLWVLSLPRGGRWRTMHLTLTSYLAIFPFIL